ncbi:MAG: hypothetical protein M1834_005946 [Cirrosporium novae-zelandiae]|nr:MAG: hypothetical protein M1834_005946 [Cirrosporium novae-zelandiae]
MATETSLVLSLVRAVGLTSSAIATGGLLATSHIGVSPIFDAPPALRAKQLHHVYDLGVRIGPPLAVLSAFCYCYLAIKSPHTSSSRGFLWAAAALALDIAPYTGLFMAKTNKRIFALDEELHDEGQEGEVTKAKEDEVGILVKRWKWLNFGRGTLPLVATICGLYAILF